MQLNTGNRRFQDTVNQNIGFHMSLSAIFIVGVCRSNASVGQLRGGETSTELKLTALHQERSNVCIAAGIISHALRANNPYGSFV